VVRVSARSQGADDGTAGSIDADHDPTGAATFDDRPGRVALAVVLLPATVAALALLAGGPAALAGVLGLVLLAVGTRRGRRDAVGGGGLALLAGTLGAGAFGAGPVALLVAGGAGLVAWDAAETAVGLGEQVGRRASVARAVGVHAAGAGLLVGVGTGVAYTAFRLTGAGPPLALVLLLAGAVALLTVLRGSR
jgi:hypothetical protein